MLLVVDVGNTQTHVGLIEAGVLIDDWRIATVRHRTGDEIAVRFDARDLPLPSDGHTRSFILITHANSKDMDLYTATPDTVEPLPFKDMSEYPYPPKEHYPDSEDFQSYRKRFNTRLMP